MVKEKLAKVEYFKIRKISVHQWFILHCALSNRNVLIDILAAHERIAEHDSHAHKIHQIAWHVAEVVGEVVLNHWKHTATYHHHHEDARCLSRVFAQTFGGEVEDARP